MRNGCKLLGIVFFAASLSVCSARAVTDEALARMDGDLVGHFHFAGTTRLTSGSAATKLNDLAAMPETAGLRELFLQRFSTAPFRLLQHKIANGNTNDYSALIRPLLEDLLHEESYAEMRGPSDAVPELMLAVHLNSNRANIWRDNLSRVISSWTGIPVKEIKGDGFTGWELKKHHDPNLIHFIRVGDWVLFGWGQNELRLEPGFLHRIKTQKRPVEAFKDDWLDVMIDWPTLMRYHQFNLPAPLSSPLPKMHLTVADHKGKEPYVRPKLVVQYPEALQIKLDPWKIPTNMIRNPLGSFTALRGVSPWLGRLEFVKKAQLPFVPNQIFFWSLANQAFDSDVAMPVAGASNYLAQAQPRLVNEIDSYFAGKKVPNRAQWTNHAIAVHGMPFIVPLLSAVHEPEGDYLRGGLLPPLHLTNDAPFPPELLKLILSQPNLVGYTWEINDDRISQWESLHQIWLMTELKSVPNNKAPALKWLRAARSKLGNCATEITLTAPNELTILRNGPVGLTGMEMTFLEHWFDALDFPLGGTYPPRMMHPPTKKAK